jgi:hypothetical protein
MTINNKTNCSLDLSSSIRRTGAWRRELFKKFPGDNRNEAAAATLEQLAIDASNMTDDTWSELRQFYNWSSPTWSNAVSQASRNVEFRGVRTFRAFIDCLVGILSQAVAA